MSIILKGSGGTPPPNVGAVREPSLLPRDDKSLYECFSESATKYPDKIALMYKKDVRMTYSKLNTSARAVAAEIKQLGIRKGDKVGIFSYNRPEWVIVDLAVLKLGGSVVPIYHTLPPSYVKYIINDSDIKLLFVENSALFGIVEQVREETPNLKNVVVFETSGLSDQHKFLEFNYLKENGHKIITSACVGANHRLVPTLFSANDIATIVYTSGTTGEPKGAILTHNNIISNAFSIIERFGVTSEDVFLSFLPLCHMFERTCGYYVILFAGGSIAYIKDLSTIVKDIKEIRPTVLITVPRLIEKVYESVEKKVLESFFIRKKLITAAIKNLNQYVNLKYKGLKIPLFLRIKRSFYDTLVASKFRKIAGGKLRVLVCGGAPLNREISKTLYVLGFNIVEGYGLTETSPVVCSNTVEENRLGTVGKPLDDVEVRIGENDEILVKGPNVMMGYLNKPEETAKTIDENGWFHTGDQGKFDEGGNLIITGRIKEIIVTSYGKKVAPTPIEMKITKSRYIEQIMLYGDTRKYITALIVPNKEFIEHYAKTRSLSFDDYSSLLQTDEIRAVITQEIEKSTVNLASYEKIKVFALLPESFTIENEMLTPTLKLRRSKIAQKYETMIDTMYEKVKDGRN